MINYLKIKTIIILYKIFIYLFTQYDMQAL